MHFGICGRPPPHGIHTHADTHTQAAPHRVPGQQRRLGVARGVAALNVVVVVVSYVRVCASKIGGVQKTKQSREWWWWWWLRRLGAHVCVYMCVVSKKNKQGS